MKWLVHELQKEVDAARLEPFELHIDTASFLQDVADAPPERTKCAIPFAPDALGATLWDWHCNGPLLIRPSWNFWLLSIRRDCRFHFLRL